MECIEKVMHGVKCSSTEAHKSFLNNYGVWVEEFLKSIVINLYHAKDNVMNIFHSEILTCFMKLIYFIVQNHVSYTESHKTRLTRVKKCKLHANKKLFKI